MMGAALNIDLYKKAYFYFDKPAEYKCKSGVVLIYPINVCDSEMFLNSVPIISVDKNSCDSVEIIQMSYLEFMYRVLLLEELNVDRFFNILKHCLHFKNARIKFAQNKKTCLCATNADTQEDIIVTAKEFEDIRRIILYQNLIHYDDEYINPDVKKMMDEVDSLKNKGIDMPDIERRMAIITAHCGISKKEQLEMTYRSHSLLFEEVYGEVEFTTTRPILLYAGKGNEIDHWIYKKKRDRFDGYVTSVESYNKSMGGDGIVKSADSNMITKINNIVNQ